MEGYVFDDQALIPVTGGEIVVRNEAQGRLLIAVRNAAGEAIAGVRLLAADEAGQTHELITDEKGQAVLFCDHAGLYTVTESDLPEGVLPAENTSMQVQVALASETDAVFEHPAPGVVQVTAAGHGAGGGDGGFRQRAGRSGGKAAFRRDAAYFRPAGCDDG